MFSSALKTARNDQDGSKNIIFNDYFKIYRFFSYEVHHFPFCQFVRTR